MEVVKATVYLDTLNNKYFEEICDVKRAFNIVIALLLELFSQSLSSLGFQPRRNVLSLCLLLSSPHLFSYL